MDIENELKKFNVTEATLAELERKYMPLVVNGIDDKQGLKLVKEARLIVKRYRIDIDKRRKELTADALELQRRINGEAKRVTALLEPIETHLANEEKKIDDEIERIKREKDEAEIARYNARVKKLSDIKFMFDGTRFFTTYLDTFANTVIDIPVLHLKQISDQEFNEFYDNAEHYWLIEQEKLAREETERKVESERIEKQRKEIEAERLRLETIAKEQAEKEAAIKAEQEKIESKRRYEESKSAVIASETECLKNGCTAPIHERPTIEESPEPEFAEVDEPVNLLDKANMILLEVFMKQSICNYIDIKLDKGLVSIENRQHYCDRGRYIVKVFSDCVKTFYVDEQDMFPRYYFIFENVLTELEKWFEARKVKVISIQKKGVNNHDDAEC